MSTKLVVAILVLVALEVAVAPPVDQKKSDEEKKDKAEDLDDFGLEYGRYLQQVVQALEEDKEFAKKLENISAEQIRSGHIAKELEFVKHNVRSKLDELKRMEVDRLRKLIQEQMERTELGLYRDEEGHLLNSPDGRRWRTVPNHRGGLEGGVGEGNFWLGLHRKGGVKIPKHVDVQNPHSFEIEDLKKLIQTATNDLEELDKKRREEFKKYELEKEYYFRESLKNMTDDQKKEAEKHHQELIEKHKDHPKIHHPGSKPQLEQVWEEQDHLPREEFNPHTFFAMHDINGDGHLDVEEIEALLIPEVKKLYNPNNEEDDPVEMEEEFHRMREHIFNETDKNKDSLISLEEFLKMTEQQEFQRDEGWKGLDEQPVYSEAELGEYIARQRQMQENHQGQYYGDQRMYYDVGDGQHGIPPQINYQVPPGGVPPQHPAYPQGQQFGAGQQGYPHPQQYPQGHPQQFQQGHPQQYQQGHPQQLQQGHPQQFQQGHPQQQIPQGHQQQQVPQGHLQQQYQQGHPQQFQQGQISPQQQYQQGHPQQQFQQAQIPLQQQYQQGHPQQFQQGQVPPQQQVKQPHLGEAHPNSPQAATGNVPGEHVAQQANSINQAASHVETPSKTQDAAAPASSVVHP